MLVTPATVLFVVGDLDQVIVDVPLTEKMLARVQAGQPVEHLRGPALGEPVIAATLSRISPFLAPGSFSTTGEIDVDNRDGRLLPGMFVTADIATGESEQATLVPTSALWEDPRTGLLGVYVVERAGEDQARRRRPTGPHAGAAAPGGDPRRGARHRRRRAACGRASGWSRIGQHLLAAQPAPGRRACARSPGSGCSSCRRASRRTCWPASWRSSSGWPAPRAPCPTTDRSTGGSAGRPGAAGGADRTPPERPPCRSPASRSAARWPP